MSPVHGNAIETRRDSCAPTPKTSQAGFARNHRMPSIGADNGCSGAVLSVAGDHPSIGQNIMDRFAFDDMHSARPRVVEQRRIQQAAADGHRRVRQRRRRALTARGGEAGAVNCLLWQRPVSSAPRRVVQRPAEQFGLMTSPQTLWRGNRACSNSATCNPRCAQAAAAVAPAGPPPPPTRRTHS